MQILIYDSCFLSVEGFCSFPHLIFSVFVLLYKNYFGSCTYHIYHKYLMHFCLVSFHHIFQFSSVAQSCLALCNLMNCSTPGFLVHHKLPELAQIHIHRVGDTVKPSHTLSSPSPSAFNLSQHQGLFQCVSSLHQVAKVLDFQLQHQFFQ